MTKFDTYNRKSYFSALLSIRNLIENSKINMKMYKMNNLDGAIELIQFCIMHIDDFIKLCINQGIIEYMMIYYFLI